MTRNVRAGHSVLQNPVGSPKGDTCRPRCQAETDSPPTVLQRQQGCCARPHLFLVYCKTAAAPDTIKAWYPRNLVTAKMTLKVNNLSGASDIIIEGAVSSQRGIHRGGSKKG